MNFTLKALVAAVALVAAGSANAAFLGNASGDGELALYVWDVASGNTFGFDLPANGTNTYTTKSILTSGDASFSVLGSAWTSFTNAFGSTASSSVKWAIFSADGTGVSTAAGTNYVGSTAKVGVDVAAFNITNSSLKQVMIKDTAYTGSTTFGSALPDASFYSTAAPFKTLIGETGTLSVNAWYNMANTTLDQTAGFWSITGNGTAATVSKTLVGNFSFDVATGSLVYVAAVPESDTYAMLLAGLGVMGLVARRRLAA